MNRACYTAKIIWNISLHLITPFSLSEAHCHSGLYLGALNIPLRI
jgi:hypothetical protein